MTDVANQRRTLAAGGVLGLYAAAVALAPSGVVSLALLAPLILASGTWWMLLEPGRWVALFFAAAFLLPPLPFAFGDSGPHAAVLFAGAGLWIGLLRRGEWRLRSDLLSRALIAFLAVLLASTSLAAVYSGVNIALGTLARVGLFGISVYLYFFTARGPFREDSFRAVRLLYAAGVAGALFACLDFYFQFPAPAGYGAQFVWLDTGVYRRAQGLFYEASTLGNFCAFFLVMIAVAFFQPKNRRPVSRIALWIGGALFSAALVFSYSRASVLNVAVAVLVLLFLQRGRFAAGKLIAIVGICAAAGLAVVIFVFPEFARAYYYRIFYSAEYFFSATEGVLSGRVATWRLLTTFLLENPWHALFGIGYKTLPYSDFVGRAAVADNMYLSLLVETGIVGVLSLAALCFAILRTAWRAARSPSPRAAFFGTWIFCFWTGELFQMLSGDLLTYWRVLPAYFFVLALAVRESAHSR